MFWDTTAIIDKVHDDDDDDIVTIPSFSSSSSAPTKQDITGFGGCAPFSSPARPPERREQQPKQRRDDFASNSSCSSLHSRSKQDITGFGGIAGFGGCAPFSTSSTLLPPEAQEGEQEQQEQHEKEQQQQQQTATVTPSQKQHANKHQSIHNMLFQSVADLPVYIASTIDKLTGNEHTNTHQLQAIKRRYFPSLENVVVQEKKFEGCTPQEFFDTFWRDDAVHSMNDFHQGRGDTDIIISPWMQTPTKEEESISLLGDVPLKAMPCPECISVMERTIAFRTPVKVPLGGTKLAKIMLKQQLSKLSPSLFILEAILTFSDVPYSNRFQVAMRHTVHCDNVTPPPPPPGPTPTLTPNTRRKIFQNGKNAKDAPFPMSMANIMKEFRKSMMMSMNATKTCNKFNIVEEEDEYDTDDTSVSSVRKEEQRCNETSHSASTTTVKVEFEVQFLKKMSWEDKLRHSLTKKMSKLCRSWCEQSLEQWKEEKKRMTADAVPEDDSVDAQSSEPQAVTNTAQSPPSDRKENENTQETPQCEDRVSKRSVLPSSIRHISILDNDVAGDDDDDDDDSYDEATDIEYLLWSWASGVISDQNTNTEEHQNAKNGKTLLDTLRADVARKRKQQAHRRRQIQGKKVTLVDEKEKELNRQNNIATARCDIEVIYVNKVTDFRTTTAINEVMESRSRTTVNDKLLVNPPVVRVPLQTMFSSVPPPPKKRLVRKKKIQLPQLKKLNLKSVTKNRSKKRQ